MVGAYSNTRSCANITRKIKNLCFHNATNFRVGKWGRSIQSRWERKRGLEEMRNEFRIRSYTHPYMKMINKPRGPYFTLCLIPQGLVLQCVWEWHWAKSSGFPWCQALKIVESQGRHEPSNQVIFSKCTEFFRFFTYVTDDLSHFLLSILVHTHYPDTLFWILTSNVITQLNY